MGKRMTEQGSHPNESRGLVASMRKVSEANTSTKFHMKLWEGGALSPWLAGPFYEK
jgi:hypothetical protein